MSDTSASAADRIKCACTNCFDWALHHAEAWSGLSVQYQPQRPYPCPIPSANESNIGDAFHQSSAELAPVALPVPRPSQPNVPAQVNNGGDNHTCDLSHCDNRFRLWPHQCQWLNDRFRLNERYQTCTTEINGEKCLKVFSTFERFKRHYRTVHIDQAKREKLSCTNEGCHRVGDKGFTRQDNLNDHMRNVHGVKIEKRRVRFGGRALDGTPIVETRAEEVKAMDEDEE